MSRRVVVWSAVLLTAAVAVGCKKKPPQAPAPPPVDGAVAPGEPQPDTTPVAFPELSPARLIEPGVRFQEATLQRGGRPMKVWYYWPEMATGKLPLVLIPPAGSTLFVGMELADGDRAEHYPYARSGFAVASFEIDGHVANMDSAPDGAIVRGGREFRASRAGLDNAKVALDFILAKAPAVDAERVYVAGHSSAGTLALLVAEHEPRVKACAAYAAVTDVEARLAPATAHLDRAIPGFSDFIRFSSPKTHAARLKCPVLLFHARNDSTVPVGESTNFAAQLKPTNPHVSLVTVPTGGHYDSMIREGIPKGIALFRQVQTGAR
ncbi:prolyl oligopeptidase family serine peptidase [bacterium]|nr:prolyl oligopeptidase family serine peptidase [bacterium]